MKYIIFIILFCILKVYVCIFEMRRENKNKIVTLGNTNQHFLHMCIIFIFNSFTRAQSTIYNIEKSTYTFFFHLMFQT